MLKQALFDMDGTLFNHDAALRRDLLSISSPEEIEQYDLENCDMRKLERYTHMQNRIGMIRVQPGWWRSLSPLGLGHDVLEMAMGIGFCCSILTKGPRSKPQAWAEKVECIDHHFGESVEIDIVGRTKGRTYGRVLVEDYPPYIKAWLEHRPRGLVILIDQEYNRDFHHEQVVRYDGHNKDVVFTALQGAFDRESGQHWKEALQKV